MKFSKPSYNLERPIFFYCCEKEFGHLKICIAEGFKELGIPFYSNINYWRISDQSEETLFCHNPDINPDDCSIVVMDKEWLIHHLPPSIPKPFLNPQRKFVSIYLDDSDGRGLYHNPGYPYFDLVLGTHGTNYNSQLTNNLIPWCFGISNRILEVTNQNQSFIERSKKTIVNFRVNPNQVVISNGSFKSDVGLFTIEKGILTFDYPLRQIAVDQFLPLLETVLPIDISIDNFDEPPQDSYDYLHWLQTDKRHYPSYYQRLTSTIACACFGGCIAINSYTNEPRVEWWDSWRFWESLAAGCVTFHVDFDKYGVNLPVKPENWRHYIGIDLDNLQATVDRIINEPQILEKISTEGRQWAIEHYSPVPTALRFLETVIAYQQNHNDRLEICNLSITEPQINLPLRDRNLVIFPDWSQSEISLTAELKQIIKSLITHPHKEQITILIDNSNNSDETANLILSSIAINLLMEEELEIDEGPEIALIGQLSPIQWQALVSHLTGRIKLEQENQEAIASVGAEIIPIYDLEH